MSAITELKAAARGHWEGILPVFGVPRETLDGKHHACPVPSCPATRDGFRMNYIAEGEWICSGKGAQHCGDGLDLIMEVTGCPIGEAMRQVAGIVHHAWAGHADIKLYGSRREQAMMAMMKDIAGNTKEEADDDYHK